MGCWRKWTRPFRSSGSLGEAFYAFTTAAGSFAVVDGGTVFQRRPRSWIMHRTLDTASTEQLQVGLRLTSNRKLRRWKMGSKLDRAAAFRDGNYSSKMLSDIRESCAVTAAEAEPPPLGPASSATALIDPSQRSPKDGALAQAAHQQLEGSLGR